VEEPRVVLGALERPDRARSALLVRDAVFENVNEGAEKLAAVQVEARGLAV